MTQGEFIRIRRQELHLTQRDLGLALGYTDRSAGTVIQNWEHGRSPVPIDKLRALAAALKIPLDSPLIP